VKRALAMIGAWLTASVAVAQADPEPVADAGSVVEAEVDAGEADEADPPGRPDAELAPEPVEGEAVTEAAPPEPVAEAPAEALVEPAPEPTPVAEPAVEAAGDEAAPEAADASEAPEPEANEWADELTIRTFADAYAQGIWTLPDPFGGDRSAIIGYRPFTHIGGLTLSFAGFDLDYQAGPIGATLNLRFGTSVPRLLGPTSGLPDGMQFLKQAFVSWRAFEGFQVDFGQFDTIYGAEVSESWNNPTYSRGALYNLVQPFYHTGFRVAYSPVDELTITGLAVNGWNNVLDDNDMKTFGLHMTYASGPLTIAGGYLGGPEGAGNEDLWRHFADVVITLDLGDVDLSANADYVAEDVGGGTFDQLWGVMAAGRVAFPPFVALALRGEYIGDPDDGTGLVTGTFTFEVTPNENIVLRLDNRVDVSTEDDFQDPDGRPSETVFSTILGVVVRSN